MQQRHPLLQRQLQRYLSDALSESQELDQFIAAIDSAYRESDRDRAMLERSLEISSKELLEINAEMRARIETLPDLLLDLSAEGVILRCGSGMSSDGLFGEDAIGKKLVDILPEQVREPFNHLFQKTMQDGEVRMLDFHTGASSGQEWCAYELRVVPGVESHLIVILRDITERYNLEQQMIRTQKMQSIGELAAGVAHEINNPLQYITYNLAYLRDEFARLSSMLSNHLSQSPEQYSQVEQEHKKVSTAFQHTEEGIRQVTAIVQAIREFTHPGQKAAVETDINELLNNVSTVTSNEWKYIAELSVELDPGVEKFLGYPSDLYQVFVNLIINGVHAIRELGSYEGKLGQIKISSHHLDDGVEIKVTDSGVGMSEEIIAQIFNPFFTTKAVGVGTGLGLSLVHNIIAEKHHGTIQVDSSPGRGSVFSVRIPYDKSTTSYLISPSGSFFRDISNHSDSPE